MLNRSRFPRAVPRAVAIAGMIAGAVTGAAAAQVPTDLTITSFSVADPEVDVFQPFQLSVAVQNAGDAPLADVIIQLSYSKRTPTPVLQEMTVLQTSSVNLQGQQSIALSWSETLPPGAYYFFAEVDPEHAIAETDEGNNFRSIEVDVLPIEISPEMLAAFREHAEAGIPGLSLGPFAVFETVRADLYPELQRYYSWGGAGVGNVGAVVRNGGPDPVPAEVLDLVSVTVEFVGAASDVTCTVPLTGRTKGPLAQGSDVTVNFYTDATSPCPRAKVPEKPCDPEAAKKGLISFQCLQVPEMRLSLHLPGGQELFGTGYLLADPKLYNNVEIVPAGLQ